jgi:transcriptional regulator with PAS, ATPase and Fis domain
MAIEGPLLGTRGSLQRKVAFGFALTLLLLLGVDGLSYLSVTALLESNRSVLVGHSAVEALDELQHQLQDAETGQRGFVITGDERYLEPYMAAVVAYDDELNHLRTLLPADDETRARIVRLRELIDAKLKELRHTIELRRSGSAERSLSVVQSGEGKALMDEIRRLITALKGAEDGRLTRQQWETGARAHYALLSLVGGSLAGLMVLAFCYIVIDRDVTARRRAEESLQAAHAALEERIRERTADLGRANERLQAEVEERRSVEATRAQLLAKLESSQGDILAIFDRLRVGTALADASGQLLFASQAACRLLGREREALIGQPWVEVFPFDPRDKEQLAALASLPAPRRSKFPASVPLPGAGRSFMEIDIQDDPRDAERRIFFFYDTSDVQILRRQLDERTRFHTLVGKSLAMQRVYELVRAVAGSDTTVLIEGETGTGKELVARAIHRSSPRRDRPFVAVNCGGLTESLLGSQLFGHKRGAFTGAVEDHRGFFEAAEGGTVLLDEIGDVPLSIQTALLRVLQEREVTRVGESRPRKVNVRILAATNHDLQQESEAGRFRADLLYRVRVARIPLPALRSRAEDIPLLVSSFMAEQREATGKAIEGISGEALRLLTEYGWPGNVRELRSAVEYAFLRCEGTCLQTDAFPPELRRAAIRSVPTRPAHIELQRLVSTLREASGNRAESARRLGISRATLYRRLAGLKLGEQT